MGSATKAGRPVIGRTMRRPGKRAVRISTSFIATRYSYRQRSGHAVTRLADRADLDNSYVSRLESGDRTPTLETAMMLAGALELTRLETARLIRSAGYWPPDAIGAL